MYINGKMRPVETIPGLVGRRIAGSRVEEAYEDISTVVLNLLQAEFSTAPAAE
jgi:hypothetical protein